MVDAIFACTAPSSLIWYNTGVGPVAQWIERLRPKEKVVRSTRAWATTYASCACLNLLLARRRLERRTNFEKKSTHMSRISFCLRFQAHVLIFCSDYDGPRMSRISFCLYMARSALCNICCGICKKVTDRVD